MIVRARAPLRLSLAGGGTDVSPYADEYGGHVLNGTIDRYAYAVIKPLDDPVIRFVSSDQQTEIVKAISEPLVLNGKLDLQKATYSHMIQHYNGGRAIPMELHTFCDAPAGSGLGSSSTLVVAIIYAFSELLNLALDDYAIARLAYKIERVDCGLQGGRQDQYAAAFGGFNFMEFYGDDRAVITPLRIKNWIICELEASLVLFYTGVSRESAKIIAEQSRNVQEGAVHAIEAMHNIKREAMVMKEGLLRGDFDSIIESMLRGWENKKCMAKSISNLYIDEIYSTAIDAGALAGKISGAGGGGYMLFVVPTEQRMDVVRALNRFEGQVSNCHFTKYGALAWRV